MSLTDKQMDKASDVMSKRDQRRFTTTEESILQYEDNQFIQALMAGQTWVVGHGEEYLPDVGEDEYPRNAYGRAKSTLSKAKQEIETMQSWRKHDAKLS